MMDTKRITTQSTVLQNKKLFVSDMNGEKVMLSIDSGKYYNLGEIGGKIWELLADEISVKQLVQTLVFHYNVEQSECEEQVLSFLENLRREGLVEISLAP